VSAASEGTGIGKSSYLPQGQQALPDYRGSTPSQPLRCPTALFATPALPAMLTDAFPAALLAEVAHATMLADTDPATVLATAALPAMLT